MSDWRRAVAEIVRVSRRRFALGLLNRHSLLWLQKGRGGLGAYRGAHWHTTSEIAAVLGSLPAKDVRYSFGAFVPGGHSVAQVVERAMSSALPAGSFMVAAGAIDRSLKSRGVLEAPTNDLTGCDVRKSGTLTSLPSKPAAHRLRFTETRLD